MPRFVKIAAFILLVCVIIAAAVPFLVPVETLKGPALARIEEATGRKVTTGKLRLSVFPDIALEAQDVKIGNPAWAEGDMADIGELRLGVELMPLLHKDVRLKELTLVDPVITLIQRGNQANWQMEKPAAPSAAPQAEGASGGAAPGLFLGRVSIKNGTVTLKDSASGTKTISAINLTLNGGHAQDKATLDASAVYEGKKASLSVMIAKPEALAQGTPTEAGVKGELSGLAFSWTGTAALKNGVPTITGNYDIPELDTTAFAKGEGKPSGAGDAAAKRGGGHWSDEPIHLEGLARVNADLSVKIGRLVLSKTTLSDVKAGLRLENGTLSLTSDEVAAYGGTVRLTLHLNSSGGLLFSMLATNVQAENLLHDFAGSDALAGTMSGHIDVTAHGVSERTLVSTLAGKGDLAVKDGSFKGADIDAMMHNVASAFTSPGESRTKFSQASGSFTLANGVASCNDLSLTSASLRASGAGTVDLPSWQVHFLIKPLLVTGGTGKSTTGITVPVRIEGALDHPSYRPDLQATLQENLKNPAAVKENLKQLKQNLLNPDAIKGLLR